MEDRSGTAQNATNQAEAVQRGTNRNVASQNGTNRSATNQNGTNQAENGQGEVEVGDQIAGGAAADDWPMVQEVEIDSDSVPIFRCFLSIPNPFHFLSVYLLFQRIVILLLYCYICNLCIISFALLAC